MKGGLAMAHEMSKGHSRSSLDNSKLPLKAHDLAFEYERKYGSCPQCVLLAISKTFGLKMDDVVKAGHALAGGAALSGSGTCGALTGGMMSLSFIYGRGVEDVDKGRFLVSYRVAKDLYDMFVEEFGGCTCQEVQKKIFGRSFDMWDAEDYKEFEKAGGHIDKCPEVAGRVARWVAEIHLAHGGKPKG